MSSGSAIVFFCIWTTSAVFKVICARARVWELMVFISSTLYSLKERVTLLEGVEEAEG